MEGIQAYEKIRLLRPTLSLREAKLLNQYVLIKGYPLSFYEHKPWYSLNTFSFMMDLHASAIKGFTVLYQSDLNNA